MELVPHHSMHQGPRMRSNFSSVVYSSRRKVRDLISAPYLIIILNCYIEADLFQYFSAFGQVADQIVMRDKISQRGRGFGFVKMTFADEDQAQQMKEKILTQNVVGGHYILDKKVDVKSADDYQGKPPMGGGMGGLSGGFPGQ